MGCLSPRLFIQGPDQSLIHGLGLRFRGGQGQLARHRSRSFRCRRHLQPLRCLRQNFGRNHTKTRASWASFRRESAHQHHETPRNTTTIHHQTDLNTLTAAPAPTTTTRHQHKPNTPETPKSTNTKQQKHYQQTPTVPTATTETSQSLLFAFPRCILYHYIKSSISCSIYPLKSAFAGDFLKKWHEMLQFCKTSSANGGQRFENQGIHGTSTEKMDLMLNVEWSVLESSVVGPGILSHQMLSDSGVEWSVVEPSVDSASFPFFLFLYPFLFHGSLSFLFFSFRFLCLLVCYAVIWYLFLFASCFLCFFFFQIASMFESPEIGIFQAKLSLAMPTIYGLCTTFSGQYQVHHPNITLKWNRDEKGLDQLPVPRLHLRLLHLHVHCVRLPRLLSQHTTSAIEKLNPNSFPFLTSYLETVWCLLEFDRMTIGKTTQCANSLACAICCICCCCNCCCCICSCICCCCICCCCICCCCICCCWICCCCICLLHLLLLHLRMKLLRWQLLHLRVHLPWLLLHLHWLAWVSMHIHWHLEQAKRHYDTEQ